jgi:hypothetical protein
MLKVFLALSTYVIMVLASSSCISGDCKTVMNDFYSKPADNWDESMREMDSLTRFNVYVCGLKYFHPAPYGLASRVAENGIESEEISSNKLETSEDDFEKLAALTILVERSRRDPKRVCEGERLKQLIFDRKSSFRGKNLGILYADIAKEFCEVETSVTVY